MARKAFIIASNGPESMGRLKYAEKDAEDFANMLGSFRYGFDIIKPRKNDGPFAILDLLADTTSECEREDDFICYFSGHGDLARGQLQLIVSSEPKVPEKISLDVDFVQKYIKNCRSKNKLLILDCCHSGGAVGMKSGGANKLLEEITPFTDNDNHIVLVASERLSKIREYTDLKGSFLTRKICEALDAQFQVVDEDQDQRISINDLMEYLQKSRMIYNKNKIDNEKVPLPYMFGQQKGASFYLTQEKYRWSPVELISIDGSTLVVLPIPERRGKCLVISKHPVTNKQYRAFLKEENRQQPEGRSLLGKDEKNELQWKNGFKPWEDVNFNGDEKPVVCVSYDDGIAYCTWLEKQQAANETRNQIRLTTAFLPPVGLWNFAAYGKSYVVENYGNADEWLRQTKEVISNAVHPSPVSDTGSRTNNRGVTDMIGNVWEWCAAEIGYNMSIGRLFRNHPILKGGGFTDDLGAAYFKPQLDSFLLASKDRIKPTMFKSFDLGFRFAGTIDSNNLPPEVQLKLSLCPPVNENFWYPIDNYKVG